MTYVPLQISCRLSFSFSFFSNNLFSDFTKTSSCDFRYNMTRTIIKVPQEPLKLMDMPGDFFIFFLWPCGQIFSQFHHWDPNFSIIGLFFKLHH